MVIKSNLKSLVTLTPIEFPTECQYAFELKLTLEPSAIDPQFKVEPNCYEIELLLIKSVRHITRR